MKTNRLLLHTTAALTLLVAAVAVQAQTPAEQGGQQQWGRGQMPTTEQRLQRMTKQLNLTEEQQQKIKPILDNESTQMQALRSDSSLSQEDRMAKMKQIRQASSEQITPILTADQQQKYTEMMSHQGRGRGGPEQNQSAPPPPQ
jgi:Spy/CpxP family protein refolding chaperone